MKSATPLLPVDYAAVERAAARLENHAHHTPVMTNAQVDRRTGCKVYFKCENFQRIGAFKFRGAYNAVSNLSAAARKRGVITYSSGNHAQAVALAAAQLGCQAVIVMPEDAPQVKLQATRGYGAEVVLYNKHQTTREALATRLAQERGLSVIPPYDHADVIAGQGTAAKELFEAVGTLDYFFVPVGGGGLISGCAVATHALAPQCRVIGVEPEAGDDATRSFKTGALQSCHNPDTVADGARTPSLGKLTFPLVLQRVHDMVTVNDTQLLAAMLYVWERMKIVVEPTGALGIAGLFEDKVSVPKGSRVGILISGGNVDVKALAPLL
ncbi:MAG: threo-3-hydroxy-L-aspartate ammonia-lyase [Betaproteobacteria bacterium]|nr:threo-3-hydroxy-L-aspartate ammonia-lyase [Betaproteobacteria bacterium]